MPHFLLFPHQLFEDVKRLQGYKVYLLEVPLFFTQYTFHIQKLIFHRASMKYYEAYLSSHGIEVVYVEVDACDKILRSLDEATCYDVADYDLHKHLQSALKTLEILPSPNFYNSEDDTLFMHHFYMHQRKRLEILVNEGKPEGGQWSFDSDNRKKLPKKTLLPQWQIYENEYIKEAIVYVKKFETFGEATPFYYPITHKEARVNLQYFFDEHFETFGSYQDAMSIQDSPLYHAMLSSAINAGLLDPKEVVDEAVIQKVPLNAKEGFIRQIIGWREFMRRTYQTIGVKQRTRNYFGFTAPIPPKVLQGKSGLLPVDDVMQKVHKRGYAHHIERLMILGNYFLLTERNPDAVYTFFMASFIDAYDWVMVGNVYGMSQYADGGLMTTKPYVSGSNYLLKMSHYPKGEWCEVWDALYWRFIYVYQEKFKENPRMKFPLNTLKRMKKETLHAHLNRAESYMNALEE
ncbi:MAG: Photolyase protein family [uncultured Sulfurovum sp.]|uniref:Photolyase protein family n=1 Tax=uncultured Sulfurovum sp. TaxID=269237 RepID=A0A6S6TUU0_9BACT|nr:MAG: Photolyase protein family [uncultured Sulfurovum sp.]